MRPLGREFIRLLAREIPFPEPIVELGSYGVDGQEDLSDLRGFFPGKTYIGCDLRPGPGVDRVEDIEALTFEADSVGSLISVDALEHVKRPWKAAAEAHRVLASGGTGVFLTCLNFKIHHHPDDYWRFTPSAMDFLFADFPYRLIGSQGAPDFPHTVFAIVYKDPPADGIDTVVSRLRDVLTDECRLPVPAGRRLKWKLGELLLSRRLFRRLRESQDVRIERTS